MMTLEQLALASQIVGTVAVLASLIFVGIQIREQASATRAQTEQAIASNWLGVAALFAENAETMSKGVQCDHPELTALNDAERMRFLTGMFALFKHYENMHMQYASRRIDATAWQPWSNHVHMYIHQPGVKTFWALRRAAFAPTFQEFIDVSTAVGQPSRVDLSVPSPIA